MECKKWNSNIVLAEIKALKKNIGYHDPFDAESNGDKLYDEAIDDVIEILNEYFR